MTKHLTILVADDNVRAREALAGFLSVRLAGSTVLQARDGVEALNILKAQSVDLVITDEVMPRMAGTVLIKEAFTANIMCPFIIITGLRICDVHVDRSVKMPIFIAEKPVKFIELQKVIENFINNSEKLSEQQTG